MKCMSLKKKRFLDTENDPNLDGHITFFKMHGGRRGTITDPYHYIQNLLKVYERIVDVDGIKGKKHIIMIKISCYNGGMKKFDKLCKLASRATSGNLVSIYHNDNNNVAWSCGKVAECSWDYAYNYYKEGKLIEENITATRVNEVLDGMLKAGGNLKNRIWDEKYNETEYRDFLLKTLPKEIKKHKMFCIACGGIMSYNFSNDWYRIFERKT